MSSSQDDTGKPLSKLQVTGVKSAARPVEPAFGSLKELGSQHIPPVSRWNTALLGRRVAGDVVAAGTAGAIVAPLITIIDKYVCRANLARAHKESASMRA